MGIRFSADEVLTLAEEIEANGAAFYRRAAELHEKGASEDVAFLVRMAEMEDQHQATFAAMRSDLSEAMQEQTAFDPDGQSGMYLDAMAAAHGGEGSPRIADTLSGEESIADVLRTAIGLEEKSILFYLGIHDMVPEKLGRAKVDAIIEEEKGHIVVLAKELQALKA